jgi:hypothetical protein
VRGHVSTAGQRAKQVSFVVFAAVSKAKASRTIRYCCAYVRPIHACLTGLSCTQHLAGGATHDGLSGCTAPGVIWYGRCIAHLPPRPRQQSRDTCSGRYHRQPIARSTMASTVPCWLHRPHSVHAHPHMYPPSVSPSKVIAAILIIATFTFRAVPMHAPSSEAAYTCVHDVLHHTFKLAG